MAVVETDRTVRDIARRPLAPLAISKRDGRLVHVLGSTLWMHGTSDGPTAMECLEIQRDEDISATMMRRARCLHENRYSMNTASNIKLLAQESDIAESAQNGPYPICIALLRLWIWIERIEDLCSDEDFSSDSEFKWSSKGLVDTGAWKLLQLDGSGASEMQVFSYELSCNVYESSDRR